MGIGTLAIKAIQWLTKAFNAVRKNRELTKAVIGAITNSEKIQKRLEAFYEKLAKVEAVHGAHTEAWKRIAEAAKSKQGCTLGADEVKYLYFFKVAFDDTIKPLGTKIVKLVDDAPITLPETPEVPELTDEEADDENLTDIEG